MPEFIKNARVSALFLFVVLTGVLMLLPHRVLGAQEDSGKGKPKPDYALIFGTVWGPNDRPVYGVPIKIRRADDKPKKVRWQLMSDHSGEFAQRVPTGKADYIIWADIQTPKGEPKPQTRVHIENDERADVGIHLPH